MQKIIIDNFRQISHAEIEVRDFLFLIGEQASGKSTIAKLIYFFRSIRENYAKLLEENADEFHQKLIPVLQEKFRIFFGTTSLLQDDFSVKYYYSIEDDYYLTLTKRTALQIRYCDGYWNYMYEQVGEWQDYVRDYKKNQNLTRDNEPISQKREEFYLKKKQEIVNGLSCDKKNCMFLPAGRNITVSYPDQFQMLFFGELSEKRPSMDSQGNNIDMRIMRDFVDYSWLLKDYFQELTLLPNDDTPFSQMARRLISNILHGDYRNEEGFEKMYHVINDNQNQFTPLSRSSSGQQESIRLIQDAMYVLNEGKAVTRIIEEPETHLFPTAQKSLIQLLIMVANKTGSQLIITTHSPHVMATFNNLLYYTRALQKEPGKRAEIEKHFGTEGFDEGKQERLNILVDKFQAYALSPTGETYCHSIFDSDTHLIGENYIDEATEEIYDDADFLYSLLY